MTEARREETPSASALTQNKNILLRTILDKRGDDGTEKLGRLLGEVLVDGEHGQRYCCCLCQQLHLQDTMGGSRDGAQVENNMMCVMVD